VSPDSSPLHCSRESLPVAGYSLFFSFDLPFPLLEPWLRQPPFCSSISGSFPPPPKSPARIAFTKSRYHTTSTLASRPFYLSPHTLLSCPLYPPPLPKGLSFFTNVAPAPSFQKPPPVGVRADCLPHLCSLFLMEADVSSLKAALRRISGFHCSCGLFAPNQIFSICFLTFSLSLFFPLISCWFCCFLFRIFPPLPLLLKALFHRYPALPPPYIKTESLFLVSHPSLSFP